MTRMLPVLLLAFESSPAPGRASTHYTKPFYRIYLPIQLLYPVTHVKSSKLASTKDDFTPFNRTRIPIPVFTLTHEPVPLQWYPIRLDME